MADEGALLAVQEANRKLGTGVLAAGVVVIFTTVAVFFSSGSRGRGKARQKLDPPRWLPENPGKRWTEIFFLKASVLWIVWFGGIVVSGVYEHFGPWSYMLVCSAMAAPYLFGPLLHPNQGEPGTPLWQRTWVKANVWILVLSYVGSYFWTHYFYNLLGAAYTFDAWRFNDVPIALYLAAYAYFCFYHTCTTICLRRFWTSHAYQRASQYPRMLASTVLILFMAYFTAFMETLTIASFPYYTIRDRFYMYTVGSVCYGIYFIVSFPMFYRLDEKKGESWTLSRAAIDSLAASMLVTILLDLWRLAVGGHMPNVPNCVPFM